MLRPSHIRGGSRPPRVRHLSAESYDLSTAASGIEEIRTKADRVTSWLAQTKNAGALFVTPPNFAWLSAGRSNIIDETRETGEGALLVAADGRTYLLANRIEMPRLMDDLDGLGFEPVEYAWTDGMAHADFLVEKARQLLGSGGGIVSDWDFPGAQHVPADLARLRYRLLPAERVRLRALGRDAGQTLGQVCQSLEPGLTEQEVARAAQDALARRGIQTVVSLVASDDRLQRFRHPLPTTQAWKDIVMVVVCARRSGLVASLTRIVTARPADGERQRKTRAAACVNAHLLAATQPGATGAELFAVAERAYATVGFPAEEQRHHQGGACGYRTRDWIAHPRSEERVEPGQAFAWNPSITGTKVEETCLLVEDGTIETLTASPGWPTIECTVEGRRFEFPDLLPLTS